MKRTLTILLSALLFSGMVMAQNSTEKNEIRLSISDGTPYALTVGLGNALVGALPFVNKTISNSSGTPHISLGYRNHVTERLAVGGDFTYQSVSYDYEYKNSGATGKEKISFYTFMPVVDFTYYQNDILKVYGNLMAGAAYYNTVNDSDGNSDQSKGNFLFSFQINPVGLQVGKQAGGFLELGAGNKGIFTLGLYAKF